MSRPRQMNRIQSQLVDDLVRDDPPARLGDHGVGGHLQGCGVPDVIGDLVATQISDDLFGQFHLPACHIARPKVPAFLLLDDAYR